MKHLFKKPFAPVFTRLLRKSFKNPRIKQMAKAFKSSKKTALYIGLGLGLFVLGLLFGLNSWDKNLYVQWRPSLDRGLAGLNEEPEILNLSSAQLSGDIRETVFFHSETGQEEDRLFFYLGNFLVHDHSAGEHRFICQIFPLAEFSFSGFGLSLSGDAGLMVIQAPCNMEDEEFIGPFWIPHREILAQSEEREFSLPEEETFIRFYNASPLLTPQWILQTVRFFHNEEDERELVIRRPTNTEQAYLSITLKEPSEEGPPAPVATKTVF